ncbi:hypothetical protein GTW25_18640 [Aliihoeflea aestuarii]|jgi:hypothetical protein|uniref:hypothetical protein n=1 Tax=Aliihoeflea aestuarii TaxID=453840 RepID=UPI0020953320|nr:hypothetical protein [Aliihoeflea aestuarii]MCO6393042.1 hypothetical protein [Aliihoeflea aestuarii]
MKRFALIAGLLLASAAAHAQPVSGWYGPLLLVTDGDRLSGVVADMARGNGTEDAPQFLCVSFIKGRFNGGVADIEAWLPDDSERIAGTLRMEEADIRVQLSDNPPGCAMISSMNGEGQRWWLEEAHPDWIGVGLVAAERAVLYPEPTEDADRERPYLIEWQAVAVLQQRESWVQVEYVAVEPAIRGWVKSSDLALASPSGE